MGSRTGVRREWTPWRWCAPLVVAFTALAPASPAPAGQAPAPTDLTVAKSSTGSFLPGTQVTYTIDVSNTGANPAGGVAVTDPLPAQTTFVSITAPPGWTVTTPAVGANGTVTATRPSFAAGSMDTFTLVVELDPAASGTLTNTVTVSSTTTDTNPNNNTATTNDQIAPLSADLSVSKSGTGTFQPGSQVTYTLVVTNAGPTHAIDVSLTDIPPAGTTFVSATAPPGWTLTTPAVGASGPIVADTPQMDPGQATFVIVLAISSSATGTLTNLGSVHATTNDPDRSNNTDETADAVVVTTTTTTTTTTVAPSTTTTTTTAAATTTSSTIAATSTTVATTTATSAPTLTGSSVAAPGSALPLAVTNMCANTTVSFTAVGNGTTVPLGSVPSDGAGTASLNATAPPAGSYIVTATASTPACNTSASLALSVLEPTLPDTGDPSGGMLRLALVFLGVGVAMALVAATRRPSA